MWYFLFNKKFILLSFLIILAYNQFSFCTTTIDTTRFTEVEKFVIKKLNGDQIADLSEFSYNINERILNAQFIEYLLQNNLKELGFVPHVIFIKNAIIENSIDLSGIKCLTDFRIESSLFKDFFQIEYNLFNGNVSFYKSKFLKNFRLNNSTFRGVLSLMEIELYNGIDLREVEINKNLNAYNCKIIGKVFNKFFLNLTITDDFVLNKSVIEGNLYGENITCRNLLSDNSIFYNFTSFAHSNVQITTSFRKSSFYDMAKFNGLDTKYLTCDSSIFQKKVGFNSTIVNNNLTLIGTIFNDTLDMKGITIGAQVKAQGTIFSSFVDFNEAEFKGDAFFEGSTFYKVNFKGVRINRDLIFENTLIKDSANFQSLITHGSFWINKSIFKGPISLIYVTIEEILHIEASTFFKNIDLNFLKCMRTGGIMNVNFNGSCLLRFTKFYENLYLMNCKFKNAEADVDFNSMSVGGLAYLFNNTFEGKVIFIGTKFSGQVILDSSKFNNKRYPLTFNVDCNDNVFFRYSFIYSPVNSKYSKIKKSLYLNQSILCDSLNLTGSEIGEDLRFDSTKIDGILILDKIKVYTCKFDHSKINKIISLKNAEVFDLSFNETSNIASLNLDRLVANGNVNLNKTQIKELTIESCEIAGHLEISNVNITDKISLEFSKIKSIAFSNFKYPSNSDSIKLSGIWFDQIIYKNYKQSN